MKEKLIVKNLHVSCASTPIVKGVSFTIRESETHILMGPNGSGKSTLLSALAGLPHTQIMKGSIRIGRLDLTQSTPEKRARKGFFLGFQHPPEIPGVSIAAMLRHAKVGTKRGEKKSDLAAFAKRLREISDQLGLESNFFSRVLNEGFSGGERKKSEILQLLVLEPSFAFLDEIDSGLDVDALRTCLALLDKLQKKKRTSYILVTHNPNLLALVNPTRVHVMISGRIVKSGGKELMKAIEQGGFEQFVNLLRQ